jgi:uncharacterized repeat protein (TIGR03943 family)
MPRSLKPLLLFGLALFLYGRLSNGAILFYINRRFVWLTWLAMVTLFLLSMSYRASRPETDPVHRLTRRTAGLVLLPILLGWLIPPQPLGTAALTNRELNSGSRAAFNLSVGDVRLATKRRAPTILDWVLTFGERPDPATFAGQTAELTGFVYLRQDLPPDTWILSRFVITCCVADATAIGLPVEAPGVEVTNDTWVRVRGRFDAQAIDGEQMPVLVADSVTPIEPPAQPYLYYR